MIEGTHLRLHIHAVLSSPLIAVTGAKTRDHAQETDGTRTRNLEAPTTLARMLDSPIYPCHLHRISLDWTVLYRSEKPRLKKESESDVPRRMRLENNASSVREFERPVSNG